MTNKEKLEQVRDNLLAQAEDINRFLDGAQISIVSARIDGNRIRVRWESESSGEFDFQWYNPEYHQPWENSRSRWTPGEFPDFSDKLHDFGINANRDKSHDDKWKVRAVTLEGEPLTEAVDVENEDPEEPEHEFVTIEEKTNTDIGFGCGVVIFDGKLRVYYSDRTSNVRGVSYKETTDMKTFTTGKIRITGEPEGSTLNHLMVVYRNGWYGMGYGPGDDMKLYWSRDGIRWEYQGRAFRGRMDGGHSFFYNPVTRTWVWTGRVRGSGDRPMRWDSKPYGRRGIARFETQNFWSGWEGGIWADPLDYFDYKPTLNPAPGVDETIGPDFYSGFVGYYDEGEKGFPSVFFQDPGRGAVDRQQNGKNTRWTGQLYSVHADVEGGKMKISSMDSPVPLEPFLRKSTHPHATSNNKEVGQMYLMPGIHEFKGKKYIFFMYRDDTHYERVGGEKRGIYAYQCP